MKEGFQSFLKPGTRAHLVGIGGVSMSALGEVLLSHGLIITGSDSFVGDAVLKLRSNGITVFEGQAAENLGNCDCVIRTAAAKNDNPEIAAAYLRGIPVFERAEAWGVLMSAYKNVICFSGTHGKTTSTSMCTQIFLKAGLDPTVMIGGRLPMLNSGYHVGSSSTIIAEACEYCNSFLNFCPTIAVINNVESDHLDFFKDLDDIKNSFCLFAKLVPEEGYVIVNIDDSGAAAVSEMLDRPVIKFGFSADADIRGENLTMDRARPAFDIYRRNEFFAHVELSVCGRHNAYNALAAASTAILAGIEPKIIEAALREFTGADRRLQFKGRYGGADIYDDYAHHPGELKALLDVAFGMGYSRVICVFQPHTYSRTKALFEDFVTQLRRPDITVLAEIYAAREKNTIGISSSDLAGQVRGARFIPTFDGIVCYLQSAARPGDIILTVGAGDVYRIGELLIEKGKAACKN